MVNSQPKSAIWNVLLSILTVILCVVILFILWPLRHCCEKLPDSLMPGDCADGFRIVIQDMDLAAWMTITNTFTWDGQQGTWDPSKNLWNGVLIQLGKYRNMVGAPEDILGEVWLIKDDPGNPVLRLTKNDFAQDTIWINVVAKRGDGGRVDPPMKWDHLDELRVTPRADGAVPSLHHYFTPYRGGITLWHDKGNGFDLCARQTAHGGEHDNFTFRLTGADGYITISRGQPGQPPSQTTEYAIPSDVQEIRIVDSSIITHLGQTNPPQEP